MDGWLKGLVAAACVAVIAGVGLYFWQAHTHAEERAKNQKEQAIRSGCTQAKQSGELTALQNYCREHGYID